MAIELQIRERQVTGIEAQRTVEAQWWTASK